MSQVIIPALLTAKLSGERKVNAVPAMRAVRVVITKRSKTGDKKIVQIKKTVR